MKHGGKIVWKAIEESGLTLTKIIKASKVPKSTFYRIKDQIQPKLDHIIKIGKAIGHDFSKDFPELTTPALTEEENLTWKFKYFEILEKYTVLLEQKEKYGKKGKGPK